MPVEVASGPTLKSTVKLPSESENGDPGYDEINDEKRSDDHNISGCNFLEAIKEDEEEEAESRGDELEEEEEEERSETCSIGECSSADNETRDDEVESKQIDPEINRDDKFFNSNKSSLSSLDSLEESLPIKRGLSNFYPGKSKSFTSLSIAANATAKDLVKPENPLNKRRRLLIAWSRNRRASCSSLVSIAESPLLPLQLLPPVVSECEEEGEESLEQDDKSSLTSSSPSERMRRDKEKKRPSLFTVTITPAEADDDHNPVLSSISISKMALRSPGRSLSLSDLSRHAHVHAMTNLD